jgi:hypothetical protein
LKRAAAISAANIRNEHQREQHSADIEQISHQGHSDAPVLCCTNCPRANRQPQCSRRPRPLESQTSGSAKRDGFKSHRHRALPDYPSLIPGPGLRTCVTKPAVRLPDHVLASHSSLNGGRGMA